LHDAESKIRRKVKVEVDILEIQFSGYSARRKPQPYKRMARICKAAMCLKIGFME
jgi:hypothetical protein